MDSQSVNERRSEPAQAGSLDAVVVPRRLKHRRPTKAEWHAILEAIGPSGVSPAEYLADWIRDQRTMSARMQDCVQKHKLGLGGEKVSDLLIADVEARHNETSYATAKGTSHEAEMQ